MNYKINIENTIYKISYISIVEIAVGKLFEVRINSCKYSYFECI